MPSLDKLREEESGLTRWELPVEMAKDFEGLAVNVVSTGFTIAAEAPA
jgi:hypothetical protein